MLPGKIIPQDDMPCHYPGCVVPFSISLHQKQLSRNPTQHVVENFLQDFTLVTILVNPITNLIRLSLILCLLTHPCVV